MPKEGYTTGKESKIVRDKDVSDYYVIVTRVERIDFIIGLLLLMKNKL